MWEKFQKISPCRLQDISLGDKNPFGGPCEKTGSCTSQGQICKEKCPKQWLLFGFLLQGKLSKFLKILKSFGIVQHIGKK